MNSPFLIREIPLYEDESLKSCLARLSILNEYASSYVVRQIVEERMGARGIEDSSALPVREATYEILAELTLLPVPRLYKATLHRFASIVVHKPHSCASFTREDVTYRLLDIGESSKVVRSMDRPGYCPVCLKERRYHRIGWQLQPVVLCVDHGLALSVRCPNCNRLVVQLS